MRFLRGSKCHKLIKYNTRKINFKGLNIEGIGAAEISLGEFSHEIQNILKSTPDTAIALDDYQFRVWELLTHPETTEEERKMYRLALFSANNYMLQFRSALQAAQRDPIGQRDNLSASLEDIRSFVSTASPSKLKTPQQRKAISEAVIYFTTKSKTKLWSIENREAQVLYETKKLHDRLMKVIRHNDLSSQLPTEESATVSDIENILISNGIVRTVEKSREYADTITRLGEKATRGDQITVDEFGDYTLAMAWFELELEDIQNSRKNNSKIALNK